MPKNWLHHDEILVLSELHLLESGERSWVFREKQFSMHEHVLAQIDGCAVEYDDVHRFTQRLFQLEPERELFLNGSDVTVRSFINVGEIDGDVNITLRVGRAFCLRTEKVRE